MGGCCHSEEVIFRNKCIKTAANEDYCESSFLGLDLSLGADFVLAEPTDFKRRLQLARKADSKRFYSRVEL